MVASSTSNALNCWFYFFLMINYCNSALGMWVEPPYKIVICKAASCQSSKTKANFSRFKCQRWKVLQITCFNTQLMQPCILKISIYITLNICPPVKLPGIKFLCWGLNKMLNQENSRVWSNGILFLWKVVQKNAFLYCQSWRLTCKSKIWLKRNLSAFPSLNSPGHWQLNYKFTNELVNFISSITSLNT